MVFYVYKELDTFTDNIHHHHQYLKKKKKLFSFSVTYESSLSKG